MIALPKEVWLDAEDDELLIYADGKLELREPFPPQVPKGADGKWLADYAVKRVVEQRETH